MFHRSVIIFRRQKIPGKLKKQTKKQKQKQKTKQNNKTKQKNKQTNPPPKKNDNNVVLSGLHLD